MTRHASLGFVLAAVAACGIAALSFADSWTIESRPWQFDGESPAFALAPDGSVVLAVWSSLDAHPTLIRPAQSLYSGIDVPLNGLHTAGALATAFDPAGSPVDPAIVLSQPGAPVLEAERLATMWVVDTIPGVRSGRPRVAWLGGGDVLVATPGIDVAERVAGAWTTLAPLVPGSAPALTVDGLGDPHLAFVAASGELGHAWRHDGVWHVEVPVTAEGATIAEARMPEIAVDALGTVHLTYVARLPAGDFQLCHRELSAGVLGPAHVVLTSDSPPRSSPLRLDSRGQPQLGWLDVTNSRLRFSARVKGTWATEPVDSGVQITAEIANGAPIALELDSDDRPWLAYFDALTELKVARRATNVGVAPARLAAGELRVSPNPRRADVSMTVALAPRSAGMVTLEIVDVAGRVVARRAPEAMAAGPAIVRWAPATLAPGVYLLRARAWEGTLGTTRFVALR